MSDYVECVVEYIDGNPDHEGCGCPRCCDALHERVEHAVESGWLTEDEARARHDNLDARGYTQEDDDE